VIVRQKTIIEINRFISVKNLPGGSPNHRLSLGFSSNLIEKI